eukprot:m.230466 g.230466  ORF g.230466 m.230466 type:complete len:156 (+) comp17060_c3_seq4:1503-1970(+)
MAATAPRSIWSRRTFFWEDPVETRRGVQPFAHNCGFSCFDPNLEQWSSSMLHMEIVAKQSCQTLLYYISAATRGIGSMIEAAYFIGRNRDVMLCVAHVAAPFFVGGHEVSSKEIKDLNRAREYLLDQAREKAVPSFNDLQECVTYAIDLKQKSQS